jgi:5,10-methylenetetrahydromethanopterin reductase
MEIGIHSQLGLAPNAARIDAWIEELRHISHSGFRRAWVSQFPWEPDIMTLFAIALREVEGVELATSVLPIQLQHPMHLAQRALTLSMISGGRFILGLGLTHAMVTEGMWGIPWTRPIRWMNEYLDGLLPLLDGQPADAPGEIVTTRGAMQIADVTAPPLYIAALKRQMLRVAGRRTAGTITWMTGPKTLATEIIPTLRDAAEEAGRPPNATRVIAAFPVAVTDDVDTIRASAAQEFALYSTLPVYQAMLEREGYQSPADTGIFGDEDTVAQRIDELRAIGVDEFVAAIHANSEEDRDRTLTLLRKVGSSAQ